MTTITIEEDVLDGLLRVSAELQLRLGRRVDYNDVIRYLMEGRVKRPELLDRAVVRGLDPKKLLRELRGERRRDEGKYPGD